MLEVNGLIKSFGENNVLKGINLEISKGEIVVIVGSSGGGKTTLLRSINRLETCEKGLIKVDNKIFWSAENDSDINIKKEIRKDIGLVFQNFNLFPHKSILENLIEAPIVVLKKDKEEVTKEAIDILDFLGIKDKINNYPFQLSGGQKQRVAVGRALMMNPKVICFDEPTSALDSNLTYDIANLIKNLSKKDMAILIVTHDMEFAKIVCDRILSMENGELREVSKVI